MKRSSYLELATLGKFAKLGKGWKEMDMKEMGPSGGHSFKKKMVDDENESSMEVLDDDETYSLVTNL